MESMNSMKSGSNLEKVIASGTPVVTAELGPPMSASPDEVVEKANILKGCCDAANITDCQTAVVRISSIAAAKIALDQGLEPVMQMTCRDRNRIAIQADILGAAALGIKNCLCIAGDHQSFSAASRLKGHAGAKNVYDVDSIQLTAILEHHGAPGDDNASKYGSALCHAKFDSLCHLAFEYFHIVDALGLDK